MNEKEKIARMIALYHGSRMAVRHDGETKTIAALHGFGSWGHSAERYSDAKWQEYENAAEAVMQYYDTLVSK